MWFKIASAIGQPVYSIKDSMPHQEFLQWGAFFEIERERYSQTDANIAQIAVAVHNHLYTSKIKIEDVLPQSRIKKPQTQSQISGKLKALANIYNR